MLSIEVLIREAEELHEEFEIRVRKRYEESTAIWDKYRQRLSTMESPWALKLREIMTPADAERHEELSRANQEYDARLHRLVRKAFELVSSDPDSKWSRAPSTAMPGSWADKYFHEYESRLDSRYVLRVGWYYVPLDDGHVHEDAREEYRAEIKGSREVVRRKGFLGLGRRTEIQRFPLCSIGVAEDDNARFQPTENLLRASFSRDDAEQFGKRLMEFVKGLVRGLS